jgi:hypothetical protein
MKTVQTPETVRRVLMDPASFTTTLITLLVDVYGTEAFTWDPTTLLLELQDDFKAVMPQITFDRIQIGIQLLTSNGFYKNCPTFVTSCNVLSGFPAGEGMMLADSLSCAWGITEAVLLAPPDDGDDEPFTEEIRAYIGTMLANDGVVDPPDILKIAITDQPNDEMFSDDPEMFAAVKSVDAGKTAEISAILRRSLMLLLEQLSQLPLKHGDASNVATKLKQVIERT